MKNKASKNKDGAESTRTSPGERSQKALFSNGTELFVYTESERAAGHKPICVWSLANTEHPMTEEQLEAREYILQNEMLPPQYDLFIFNGSCETSINIRGHVDYFIAHTANPTNLTQARGRYRGDLDLLYVYDKENGEIIVPVEFLGIQLFTDNKRELRARLGLKDEKGHPIPYGKLEVRLEQCGYHIEYGRKDNNRFIIIRKE